MTARAQALLATCALAACLACPRAPAAADAGPARAAPALAADGADAADVAEPLLRDLEKDEAAWRASTDWATHPASDEALGPDPVDLVALPASPHSGGARFAGVLRGAAAVVLLDAQLRELDRAPAPRGARSVAVHPDGAELLVGGELDDAPAAVRFTRGRFTSGGRVAALAAPPGVRGVGFDADGRALVVDVTGAVTRAPSRADAGARGAPSLGALALAPRTHGAWTAVAAPLQHRVALSAPGVAFEVAASDGPVLGVAVRALASGDALVAIGMLEDHPLDRTIGSFGYIDSFLRVVRVARDAAPGAPASARVIDVNLSEHGVVTPKALAFLDDDTVLVAGAGSAKAARVTISTGAVTTLAALPGVVALVPTEHGFVGASPLLDAWVVVDAAGARAVPVGVAVPAGARTGLEGVRVDDVGHVSVDAAAARPHVPPVHPGPPGAAPRTAASRLGEALVFTTIMAPRQKSDGALSRFTCEACHFEGVVDGRTHDTGRMGMRTLDGADDGAAAGAGGDAAGDGSVDGGAAAHVEDHVRATTKPLWGLFNNTPLFTRAMDPNITRMVHAEFRVANSNSPLEPWFALTPADAPWLALLGVDGTRSPIELRHAVVSFLRDFTPRANPFVVQRLREAERARATGGDGVARFSALERRGAEVFRARCASCHAARLVGDDPASEQPFTAWEALVLRDNGPLVWSSPEHRKTGVEPYVHDDGARASSLRRVWLKAPLFTTGAAGTLEEALAMARLLDDGTFAHSSKRGAPLEESEQRALLAFLRLL